SDEFARIHHSHFLCDTPRTKRNGTGEAKIQPAKPVECAMYRKPQLSVETLEIRDIPSIGLPIPDGISLSSDGVLYMKGGWSNDNAHVWIGADNLVHAKLTNSILIVPGGLQPIGGNPEMTFAQDQVKSIDFLGYEGDDSFTNDTWIKCVASGGVGDD